MKFWTKTENLMLNLLEILDWAITQFEPKMYLD